MVATGSCRLGASPIWRSGSLLESKKGFPPLLQVLVCPSEDSVAKTACYFLLFYDGKAPTAAMVNRRVRIRCPKLLQKPADLKGVGIK